MDSNFKDKRIYHFFKRIFDIVFSFLAIGILSPLLIILGIFVCCSSKGGPFYLDDRIGKNKKKFKLVKFRSMKKDARPIKEILTDDQYKEYCKTFKLKNDPRVTKIGKFLRKTSLDELPQLFNIFIGQMSFVGPRPIVEKEYELLWGKENDWLFLIKPGLTGYWAVNGRSDALYKERIELEKKYLENESFWLDIKILFKTVIVTITRKGAE